MRVIDVMTTDVITVAPETSLKEAARRMIAAGISGLPVVDEDGRVVGIITEADFVEAEADRSWGRDRRRLLDAVFGERRPRQAQTVEDAMSRNPLVVDHDSDITEAARKMTDHNVKRLPVVNPDGRLEGIISRADIMMAFARPDETIALEVEKEVIRRILMLDPDDISVDVVDGVVTLSGEVPNRSDARLLEELAGRLEGVTRVDASLNWTADDTKHPESPSVWR